MNKFHAEKLVLANLQLLFNLANFLPFLIINNNDHSAYSEINLKLFTQGAKPRFGERR